jgi:hypothetical protein
MKQPHTPVSEQAPPATDSDVLLVQDLIGELSPAESGQRPEQASLIADFVEQIDDRDSRLRAASMLLDAVGAITPQMEALLAERDQSKFGDRIAEVSPEDIPKVTDRLLSGQNVAAVVRADSYDSLEDQVMKPLLEQTNLSVGSALIFPNSMMRKNGALSSAMHIDVHPDQRDKFPYTLSLSEVSEGSVLFIAGFAPKKAGSWSQGEYDTRKTRLNAAPAIQRLYSEAEAGMPPRSKEIHVAGSGMELDLSVIRLEAGDVVIWPQGGPGAERADWHAFRQIGDSPRTSITRHFVQPRDVIDLT